MKTRTEDEAWALTEREKQTLRLIVRGHDAKSIARTLDLSVHTINERLRDVRRKMAVSSSREAARLLLESEESGVAATAPNSLGDNGIGEDAGGSVVKTVAVPIVGTSGQRRRPRTLIIGAFLMTIALGLMAFAILSPIPSTQSPTHTSQVATDPALVESAQRWLTLIDQEKWDESYRATGAAFQKLNTVENWARVSREVRLPLGAMLSRTFVSYEELPAPPSGYDVVKFRTRFANKADAIETVTLEREAGAWRVVGVMID